MQKKKSTFLAEGSVNPNMPTLKAAPDKLESKIRIFIEHSSVLLRDSCGNQEKSFSPGEEAGKYLSDNLLFNMHSVCQIVNTCAAQYWNNWLQVIKAWISVGWRDIWLYSLESFFPLGPNIKKAVLSCLSCENCFSSFTFKCSYKENRNIKLRVICITTNLMLRFFMLSPVGSLLILKSVGHEITPWGTPPTCLSDKYDLDNLVSKRLNRLWRLRRWNGL